MKLNELKRALPALTQLTFVLPEGQTVPAHFHVTEVGEITRRFIDCGGTLRTEQRINFQLWEANDFDHRLAAEKMLRIINESEQLLGLNDELEIEVEYQRGSITKFGLELIGSIFHLTNLYTDCLAQDKCGIPQEKQKVKLADLTTANANTCTPGGGCC
jgi:hypothetical protein